MQYTGTMGGNKAVSAGEDAIISLTDLEDEQSYIFYAVAVDEAGNISVKEAEPFEVLDASPPNIEPTQMVGMPGGKRLKVSMTPDEPGEYYYYYEEMRASGIRQYSTEDILDFVARKDDNESGQGTVTEAGPMDFQIHNLKAETTYVVYIVMKDEYGNMMAEPKVLTSTTTELDDTYPYIVDGRLHAVTGDYYEFDIHVNEALDPTSANDINNYELSGTAIINVDGQPTTIKPDKVTYVAGEKTIRVRIPSATALVNGDTIVVKILTGVTDLAENPFVNINVVETTEEVKNTASYIHNDTLLPQLTIEKFQPNAQKTSGILTYRANKAGTYYYMIIPNSYDMKNMLPRDFYNEFTSEPTLAEPIPNIAKQGDNGANTVTVGSQLQSINLPTSTNPFESYSLYMIMKDRSGQLSTIQKVENVIDDSRAPFVRQLEVVPEEGFNDRISITLDTSEGGRVYYKRFKKNTTDPLELAEMAAIRTTWQNVLSFNKGNHYAINNEDAKEYVKTIRSWQNSQLKNGEITVIRDIVEPHTEYVYFFAVEDSVGNITMYPSQLSAPQAGVIEDYTSSIMEKSVYSDGINPKVLGKTLSLANEIDIFSILPPAGSTGIADGRFNYAQGRTFTMTFSELMTYKGTTSSDTAPITYDPNTLSKLKEVIDTKLPGGTTVTDIEWQKDYANLNSWDEHTLIFTVSTAPTASVTLDENDFALFSDLAIRRITDETKLEYLPTTASLNGIVGIGLNRDPQFGYTPATQTLRANSRAVTMQLEINDVASRELRYFYAVQNDTETSVPTAEQIINYIKYQTSPNKAILDSKFDLGGFDNVRLGTGEFDGINTGGAFKQELILSGNNVFYTGQKLYFVTIDKYGNIVGSRISPNSTGLTGGVNHAKITE